MGYDLVSFDLDGTLVDSASEIVEAANRALESHGIARRPGGEITLLIGAGAHALMLRLLAQVFVEQPALADRLRAEEVLASFDHHYAETTGTTSVLYEGTLPALAALRDAGVRLACVTNKELRHTRRVLQAYGLDTYFDAVIGGDSLPHKKPHPSVLRHVVDHLGSDPRRTAHVGDSATDVEAARNAGVSAWAVPYGYNAGQPIEAARPERIFGDLRHLAEHVIDTRRVRPGGC
jgi:phosphoglycolate phosphatase